MVGGLSRCRRLNRRLGRRHRLPLLRPHSPQRARQREGGRRPAAPPGDDQTNPGRFATRNGPRPPTRAVRLLIAADRAGIERCGPGGRFSTPQPRSIVHNAADGLEIVARLDRETVVQLVDPVVTRLTVVNGGQLWCTETAGQQPFRRIIAGSRIGSVQPSNWWCGFDPVTRSLWAWPPRSGGAPRPSRSADHRLSPSRK